MTAGPALVWFRQDLRLMDNPAFTAGCSFASGVIPVFIWSPEEEGPQAPGAASRWWLHHSLTALQQALRESGSQLLLRRGSAQTVLGELIRVTGARAVFWNRRYEPAAIARDTALKKALLAAGVQVESFNSNLLFEPWEIATKTKQPYQVFSPYWRACLAGAAVEKPLPVPAKAPTPASWPESEKLDALGLLPRIDWAAGLRAAWRPGEAGAHDLLERFLDEAIAHYGTDRDRPEHPGTSRLSPHLHFGEISPRQIWHAVQARIKEGARALVAQGEHFLREVGWREFAHHLLYHFPHTVTKPLRPEFERFPWSRDRKKLRAWQRGQTGYPIVDAGMRELWHTGWMHNRVRMIVASFLVKDLLISWQEGAAWFHDTLVDADLANNTLGWQWTAGCGADAAPYFRVFNPVIQAMKFDPDGTYVRHWVPELAQLPLPYLHRPWTAASALLRQAGVKLGKTYPWPLVDHGEARARALAALAASKSSSTVGVQS